MFNYLRTKSGPSSLKLGSDFLWHGAASAFQSPSAIFLRLAATYSDLSASFSSA